MRTTRRIEALTRGQGHWDHGATWTHVTLAIANDAFNEVRVGAWECVCFVGGGGGGGCVSTPPPR